MQARRQCLHAFLLGVLGKEILALGLGGLGLLLGLAAEEVLNGGLGLGVRQLGVSVEDISDGLREIVDVKVGGVHLLQLVPDAHAKGVAYFVHYFLFKICV